MLCVNVILISSFWYYFYLQDNLTESALPTDPAAVKMFATLQTVVYAIRNARAQYNVDPGRKVACVLVVRSAAVFELLAAERAVLGMLARIDETQLQIVLAEKVRVVGQVVLVVFTLFC